jgi:hypothetical protein
MGPVKRCPGTVQAPHGAATTLRTTAAMPPLLVDGGGPVLTRAQVVVIFWGSYWQTATASPSTAEVTQAVQRILVGPYMSDLAQYRGITNAQLHTTYTTAAADGDPPQNFTDTDVTTLVTGLIEAGKIPAPIDLDDVYYAVVLPLNVAYVHSGYIGVHWSVTGNGARAAIGWSGNNGVLGNITEAFCHELVEACSDPYGDGFTLQNLPVGDEIADACQGQAQITVNGFKVAQYWSARLQECFPPTSLVTPGVLQSLSISPSRVTGGNPSHGTVTLDARVPMDTRVAVGVFDAGSHLPRPGSQSSLARITPEPVIVRAGDLTAGFTITTSPVAPHTTHTATVIAAASVLKYAALTVTG